jgi:hypothetical protein
MTYHELDQKQKRFDRISRIFLHLQFMLHAQKYSTILTYSKKDKRTRPYVLKSEGLCKEEKGEYNSQHFSHRRNYELKV